MRKILTYILLTLTTICGYAQNVTFNALGPGLVEVGERFTLTYSISAQPSGFEAPALDNFYVVAGPSTSTSTNVQIVNGNMTRSYTVTYTYVLQANSEGKFTIPPAKATVDKKTYTSNAVVVEVIKQSKQQHGGGGASGGGSQAGGSAAQQEQASTDDLFVAIELSKRTAYIGEPIEAYLKVYSRLDISGFEDVKFPNFNGFWSQELSSPQNITFQRTQVNGRIYNMATIRSYLLYPQQAGKAELEPFELGVIYTRPRSSNRPRSIFDEFFGGGMEQRRTRLVSRPVTINVEQLPGNAPASFSGAVGSYKMTATADKNALTANEAVTIKVKISGTGNFKLIGTPKVQFPQSFEVFDPKISENAPKSVNASGSKTYEYTAIPRAAGSYTVAPIEFAYFDLTKRAYVTLRSEPFELNVAADSSARNVVVSGYSKEDVKFIGSDIRFIKTGAAALRPMHSYIVQSGMYRFAYLLALVLFVVLAFIYSKRREQMANTGLMRTRKANKAAQRRLKQASSLLASRQAERFYEEINHAMMGYAADKFGIARAELTLDNVREQLQARGIAPADVEKFAEVVNACEYARFSPTSEHSQMDGLYADAYELITRMEQQLKTK